MSYISFENKYDKFPTTKIKKDKCGFYGMISEIISELAKFKKGIICFETYPGVDQAVLKEKLINKLNPDKIINVENYRLSYDEIDALIGRHLFNDRVFGLYSHHQIEDFYNLETISKVKKKINTDQLTVVYGFGAFLLGYDCLVMVSLTRWEIQLRYRNGLANFTADNPDDDILLKYKRGYFIEWRVADRIKDRLNERFNYLLDYTVLSKPKMINKENYELSLDQITKKPFRIVPYFDPGVWGGQWMKEVCLLDESEENFAWSFDGVPEENSIRLGFGDDFIELPAQDLVLFRAKEFMGKRVLARFGKKFPIRFDFLDTIHGQNLSLQVHPQTDYIMETFGMTYTQDESYYFLDALDDAVCYVGFKKNINVDNFKNDLIKANRGEIDFDDELYINKIPVKKHDHLLLPAGTVHGSGKNSMVLEISSCVYIFTFKLWDWGRLGLDGLPRPVHLEHGFKNIDFSRDSDFIKNECYNRFEKVNDIEEITGLHELEFIETRRYTITDYYDIVTDNTVNVCNLVEGKSLMIESLDGSFDSFIVHYAETFYIPATISKFRFKALEGKCIVIRAKVR